MLSATSNASTSHSLLSLPSNHFPDCVRGPSYTLAHHLRSRHLIVYIQCSAVGADATRTTLDCLRPRKTVGCRYVGSQGIGTGDANGVCRRRPGIRGGSSFKRLDISGCPRARTCRTAIAGDGVQLALQRVVRHDHVGRNAPQVCRKRQGLPVVARAVRSHPCCDACASASSLSS